MNSFSGQREAYSLELSVTARTPVATVCPTSPERSLSPGKVAEPPGKNLWEQICEGSPKEYLETFIFPVLLPGIASLLHQAKKEKCFERKRTKFIACDFLTEWLYNQNPKRTGKLFTEFFSIPFVEQWLKQYPRPPIPLSLRLTEEEAALSIQSFWRAYLELESEKQGCQQPSCLCVKNLWRNYCRGSRAERQRREGLSLRTVLEHLDSAVSVRCDPEIQELRQWQKKLREDKHIRERVKIFWAKQERKVKYKMEEEEEEESIAATPAP
ncbi:IQ domain-containing protein K isoform X9 [Desmodus rotundus]|uniref:IQ domain-containing protein K isoform X9 n=1 Tax=Desmodus rotundus TaxID=9430 RepID=UPI0023816AAA|nr:IQ domain-containing protein K isoform X9 [Desmodus rotundus]